MAMTSPDDFDQPLVPGLEDEDTHQSDPFNFDMMKDSNLDKPLDPTPMGDNHGTEEAVVDSTTASEDVVPSAPTDHVTEDDQPQSSPDSSVQLRTNNPFLCFMVSLYHSQRVNDLLLWKNIPVTAGVLILFLYSAFSMALLSMLSVIGYYGLGIIILHFAIRIYRTILDTLGKQQASSFFPLELMDRMSEASWQVPRESVLNAVEKACDSFNDISEDLRDIILVRSYKRTLKVAALLYFLTWVGSIFNLLTIIIVVVVNLFYIPLLFTKFDKEINAVGQQIHGHYKHATAVALEKMPFLAKFFENKVKTS